MSAPENLGPQWHQLPMFVQAKSLINDYHPNDYVENGKQGDQNPDHTWVRKIHESKRTGPNYEISVKQEDGSYKGLSLYDHIKQHGVNSAVFVQDHESARGEQPRLWDGHHRAASAASSRPDDLVPVVHATSMNDRMNYKQAQDKAARTAARARRRG